MTRLSTLGASPLLRWVGTLDQVRTPHVIELGSGLNLPVDLAPTVLKAALGPLVDIAPCFVCKEGIQQTVKSLVAAWVGIKVIFQTL